MFCFDEEDLPKLPVIAMLFRIARAGRPSRAADRKLPTTIRFSDEFLNPILEAACCGQLSEEVEASPHCH